MYGLTVVKGGSATGKSTRVRVFKEFLEKVFGIQPDEFYYENCDGKKKLVGYLFKEINLLFVGYYTKKGDWQGADGLTSHFKNMITLESWVHTTLKSHNVIIEGTIPTRTHRMRPERLVNIGGVRKILLLYFIFDINDKDTYIERVTYRSGRPPLKNTGWEAQVGYLDDLRKAKEELFNADCNCSILNYSFDASKTKVGEEWLRFFVGDYIDEMKRFKTD